MPANEEQQVLVALYVRAFSSLLRCALTGPQAHHARQRHLRSASLLSGHRRSYVLFGGGHNLSGRP